MRDLITHLSCKIIALLMLCFTGYGLHAQINIEATKQKIAAHHKRDSVFVLMHLQIAKAYLSTQSDSALKYATTSKTLAESIKNKSLTLSAYNYLGQSLANKGLLQRSLDVFVQGEKFTATDAERSEMIRDQGNIQIEMGKPDEAIALYKKALVYADLGKDKKSAAITNSNISYVYRQQGKYEDAAVYQLKAIKVAEEVNDPVVLAGCNIQLALIQYTRKLYTDATAYATEALRLYQKLDARSGISTAYTILGGCASENREFDKAWQYFTDAYNTNVAIGDAKKMAASANDLAELEMETKHYDSAFKYNTLSLESILKTNIAQTTISTYTTRAKILTALNKPNEARINIDKALELSRKGKYKDLERKALEVLALIHSAKGDHASAFETQLKTSALHDSILNETNSKQINQLRTQYETEKKEKQILILNTRNDLQKLNLSKQQLEITKRGLSIQNQQLELNNKTLLIDKKESEIRAKAAEAKQQQQKILALNQKAELQRLELRQRNIYLAAAVLLLLAVAGIGYLLYSRRQAKAQLVLQREVNRQQEITAFEVLSAEERERKRMGSDLHDGVGQLLSAALLSLNRLMNFSFNDEEKQLAERSLTLVTEGYDEIRSISHQIMPSALLKYGLGAAIRDLINKIDNKTIKISVEIAGIDERLDEQTETVLYRVVQETVNNVIKHAQAGKLNIQLVKDEDGISLTVEDNGKGFDIKKLDNADGIGMRNIYSRVSFLKGSVDVQSSPGKGTLIAVFIKG